MAAANEAGDIQAIVDRGFGSLTGATYLLLRVAEGASARASARAWLRKLPVTSLADARGKKLDRICQLAFTAAGLKQLGFDPEGIDGFAPEFLEGMAGTKQRSHQLGDEDANAPDRWEWGIGTHEPHILVILLAPAEAIAAIEAEYVSALPGAGCELVRANRTNGTLGREPFGFADGLSQPEPDWDGTLVPGGAKDRLYRNRIAMGEFLLGHPNEYGFVTDYPSAGEVGRNGSYLVYRQLAQKVRGMWTWLKHHAGERDPVRLAEWMVGRRIDGDPLPGLGAVGPDGQFTFGDDPDGVACPIGAHIRRANPRSGDDPQGHRGFLRDVISSLGLKGTAMHDAVASARFHRLLRRGRAYGPAITPDQAMHGANPGGEEEAGLHFLCLNANLSRQFEFVQGAWIASAYFAGLSGEQDAMLGTRLPANGGGATDAFSFVDEGGCPQLVSGLPQFVTMRGGAYFFLPGLNGLRQILAE